MVHRVELRAIGVGVTEVLSTTRIQRGPSDSLHLCWREWPRLPFTARIQRGESALRQAQGPELSRGTTARCASTEDHQPQSPSPLPPIRRIAVLYWGSYSTQYDGEETAYPVASGHAGGSHCVWSHLCVWTAAGLQRNYTKDQSRSLSNPRLAHWCGWSGNRAPGC